MATTSIDSARCVHTAAAPETRPMPTAGIAPARRIDRQLALAVLLVGLIAVPRSLSITRAHSETYDESYHRLRGLAFLTRSIGSKDLRLNDPPLGEGIVALPMLATNLLEGRAADDTRLYDRPGRAETIAARIALWNALLFLPLAGIVFHWCRSAYGLRAAWLATAILAIEPNFAAHLPLSNLDVLGVTGIVAGCYLGWRCFEQPTIGRQLALGAGVATALMLKHTSAILPMVVMAMAGLWWFLKPRVGETEGPPPGPSSLAGRLGVLARVGAVAALVLWALTLFDMSPPVSPKTSEHALGAASASNAASHGLRMKLERALHLTSAWPAGSYFRAFRSGLGHGMGGHEAYLFGQRKLTGWWYYFPVVASYKVPLGVGFLLLLGVVSLVRTPPRWAEWGLFVPMLGWTLFMMSSKVNIGFRHILPAYLFAIMLGSRCVAGLGAHNARGWLAAAWGLVLASAIHAAAYHPDELAYINAPRHKPYLAISDSNVDWGQGLKQARAWIDAHPHGGRTVWLRYFGVEVDRSEVVPYYLGDRVKLLGDDDPMPEHGLLIVSPIYEADAHGPRGAYKRLQPLEPMAVIGRSLLVYDLDRLDGPLVKDLRASAD